MEILPFDSTPPVDLNLVPYPGLRPFKRSERRFFYGREQQVAEICEILAGRNHVTAIGPSGCGKSSLIRAGVRPALEMGLINAAGQLWVSASMRPGNAPLAHLRDALLEVAPGAEPAGTIERARIKSTLGRGRVGLERLLRDRPVTGGGRLLLLIDQFEELFRFDTPRDEAESFVRLIVELFENPLPQVYLILTMRTDFIGDCTRFDGLAEVINRTFYLIPPLTRDQLRAAVAEPAVEVGGRVEPELIERVLEDMHDSEDALPLVQHALMWMWIRARRRGERGPIVLGLDDYHDQAVGGLAQALSHHADWVVADASLGPQRERDVELLFRQLVQSDDGRLIRRPVQVGELIESTRVGENKPPLLSRDAVERLVERLSRDDCGFVFLQSGDEAGDRFADDAYIDIGHEALIRRWRRLRDWASNEAHSGQRMRDLAVAAQQHKRGERGMLGRTALETFERAFRATLKRYCAGHGCDADLPPLAWARRHLSQALTRQLTAPETLYAGARDYWRKSRLWRMVKPLIVVVIPALILAGFALLNLYSAEDKRVNDLWRDITGTFQRSMDAGEHREGPTLRELARRSGEIARNADSLVLSRLWRGDDIDANVALSREFAGLYRDLADLHGVEADGAARLLVRPYPQVPITGFAHFENPAFGGCLGVLDAVGVLAVGCGREMLPSYIQLDAKGVDAACFGRDGCDDPSAIPHWLTLSRMVPDRHGGLTLIAPDGGLHRCRPERDRVSCTRLADPLVELGENSGLLGVAMREGGRHLVALNQQENGIQATLFELNGERAERLESASRRLDMGRCDHASALIHPWIGSPPEDAETLLLRLVTNFSDLCEWVLLGDGADAMADRRLVLAHPAPAPMLTVLRTNSDRMVLTSRNRPLSFFDLKRSDDPIAEWTLLTRAPTSLALLDDDMLAIADDQARVYLTHFGERDLRRLDPPPRLEALVERLAVAPDKGSVYGVTRDREGARIVHWPIGERVRARRVMIDRPSDGDTLVARQRRCWRDLIDSRPADERGVPTLDEQIAPGGIQRYALPGGQVELCVQPWGRPVLRWRDPGAADAGPIPCNMGSVNNRSKQNNRIAELNDLDQLPRILDSILICNEKQDPEIPSGCWLELKTEPLDPFGKPLPPERVIYHLPRIGVPPAPDGEIPIEGCLSRSR